jgi:RNA polymerase sigma factor (TIGR02999 family)
MKPEELIQSVYNELRHMASAKLQQESPSHSLSATALVHEVWLKLADASIDWQDRNHFLRMAVTAMRRILVDHARAKLTQKRGGGAARLELLDIHSPLPDKELLELDEALSKLADIKPDHAKLIELRYFAGLTGDEAAEALGVSPANVDRMWRYARAWLLTEMKPIE